MVASMSDLPESGHGSAAYESTSLVWFSDDRWAGVIVLVVLIVVTFLLIIIIVVVGFSRRHEGDQVQPGVFGDARGHVGLLMDIPAPDVSTRSPIRNGWALVST